MGVTTALSGGGFSDVRSKAFLGIPSGSMVVFEVHENAYIDFGKFWQIPFFLIDYQIETEIVSIITPTLFAIERT